MYKVIATASSEEFEKLLNELAEEGWRLHSWGETGGDEGVFFSAVLIKECPA